MTRTLACWAKGLLSEAELHAAAMEVMDGRYEADLGGGLCKKRVARPGQGKSGASRTLVATRHGSMVFFIAGRRKSDPGPDFSTGQEAAARVVAKGLRAADDRMVVVLLVQGTIKEIADGPQDEPQDPRRR